MSEKWQQISLKLDGELAQALRDMKKGHDESVSEVVIRLLKKVVRQSSPSPRVAPPGRSNPKADRGRGAFGGGKRSAPRAAPAAETWGAPRGKGQAVGAATPPRFAPAPRRAGKAARPQPLDGSGEPRRRGFRARTDGPRPMRPRDELGTAEDRPKRPRKAKARRASGG